MSGSKGLSFTFEAILAGFLILSSLLFFFKAPNLGDTSTVGVSEMGYDCLRSLDENNELREYAMNNDNVSIGNKLQHCLDINYTVQICRDVCNSVAAPANQTVVVSNYFIAGDKDIDPLYVKLNMWLP